MRRPSPLVQYRSTNADIDSAMTPMIDVVFLLLVFFVWTASFQIVEQILPGELSSQAGTETTELTEPPPEADFDQVIVRIGWNGIQPEWRLNDQLVESIDRLRVQLATISRIKSDAPVILHPVKQVPLDFVIQAYDASKLAGFAKVSFAINPDPS